MIGQEPGRDVSMGVGRSLGRDRGEITRGARKLGGAGTWEGAAVWRGLKAEALEGNNGRSLGAGGLEGDGAWEGTTLQRIGEGGTREGVGVWEGTVHREPVRGRVWHGAGTMEG